MSGTDFRHQRQIYVAVNLALALPVVIWPIAWLNGGWPDTGAGIQLRWLASAASLLMAVVVADTVLSGMRSNRQILSGTVWIVLVSQVVGLAFRTPHGMFLIACLFGLHALRAATALWYSDGAWWLWPAWVRDTVIPLTLFGWMIAFHHA